MLLCSGFYLSQGKRAIRALKPKKMALFHGFSAHVPDFRGSAQVKAEYFSFFAARRLP